MGILRETAYGILTATGVAATLTIPTYLSGDAGPSQPKPDRCWTQEGADRVHHLGAKVAALYANAPAEQRLSASGDIIGVRHRVGNKVVTFVLNTDGRRPDGSLDTDRTLEVSVWSGVAYDGPRPDETTSRATAIGAGSAGPPPRGCPPWSSPVDAVWSIGEDGGYISGPRIIRGTATAQDNPPAPCVGDALLDNIEDIIDSAANGAMPPEVDDPTRNC